MRYYRTRHYESINERYVVVKGNHILELDSRIPDCVAETMTIQQRVLNSMEVVKYPALLYFPPMWDLKAFVELHQKYGADWQVIIDLGMSQHSQFSASCTMSIIIDEIESFILEHPRFIDALRAAIDSNNVIRIRKLATFARKKVTTVAERCVWKNDSTLRLKNHLRFILSVAEGVV